MKSIEFIVDEYGQVKIRPSRRITSRRSIFADVYIIDDVTCEVKLVKHLNKTKVDRSTCRSRTGKWNKTGNRARMKGNGKDSSYNSKSQRKIKIIEKIEEGL